MRDIFVIQTKLLKTSFLFKYWPWYQNRCLDFKMAHRKFSYFPNAKVAVICQVSKKFEKH